MFPLKKSKGQETNSPGWGIKEVKPRQKGVIYHATGRLKQSSGFTHVLLLSSVAAADFSRVDDGLNRSAVEQIQRDERRERLRGAAGYLFGANPNFAIAFYADPGVGQRRKLLERGLCLRYPGHHSASLGVIICRFLVATATDMDYTVLPWLISEGIFTCRFWHSAALVAYVRAVMGDDR